MNSKIHYVFCTILIAIAFLKTYINLQRPDIEGGYGLWHWAIVGLMLVGAIYQYNKANKLSD